MYIINFIETKSAQENSSQFYNSEKYSHDLRQHIWIKFIQHKGLTVYVWTLYFVTLKVE